MNKLSKAQKEVNLSAEKYSEIRKKINISNVEVQKVRNEFNKAVSNWYKLDSKKTINFLKDPQNKVIVPMQLKKKFDYKGFNFAIIIEPKANHKYYTLINFETGGKVTMVFNDKKTIKNFHKKSIEALDKLINKIGLTEFSKVLNSYPTIN